MTPHLAILDGTNEALGARTNSLRLNKARVTIRVSDPGASRQASDVAKMEGEEGFGTFPITSNDRQLGGTRVRPGKTEHELKFPGLDAWPSSAAAFGEKARTV